MYFNFIINYSYNFPLTLFIVDMGFKQQRKHPLNLFQKKASRIITNNDYITHTYPLFAVSAWKFHYKIANGQLSILILF